MALLRRIGSQAAVYGLGYGFTRLLGFALLPLYTRYLSPAEYGVLALLLITGQVSSILSQAGLGSAMFREVIYEDSDRRLVESTVLWFLVGTAACVLAVAWLLSPRLSQWMFGSLEQVSLLRLTFVASAFNVFEAVLLARLRIEQRPALYTVLAVSRFAAGALITVWFLVVLGRGLTGLVEATALLSAIFALVYLGYLWRAFRLGFSLPLLKRLLRFGAPLVPANVSGLVMASSDRYFLQHFAGAAQVGLYSLGYTVGQLMAWFVNAIQLAWPAQMFELARKPDAEAVLAHMLTLYTAVMAWLALAVSLGAPEIVHWMSTKPYYEAASVVPWVAASYVFFGGSYMVNSGLAVRDKMKYSGLVAMVVAVLNLLLNVWLIPEHGPMGAAWATCASYGALAVLQTFANQRVWKIPYQYGKLAVLVLGWLAALWLASLAPAPGWGSVVLRLALLLAFGGLAWKIGNRKWGPTRKKRGQHTLLPRGQ